MSDVYSPRPDTKMLEKMTSNDIAPGFAVGIITFDGDGGLRDKARGFLEESRSS